MWSPNRTWGNFRCTFRLKTLLPVGWCCFNDLASGLMTVFPVSPTFALMVYFWVRCGRSQNIDCLRKQQKKTCSDVYKIFFLLIFCGWQALAANNKYYIKTLKKYVKWYSSATLRCYCHASLSQNICSTCAWGNFTSGLFCWFSIGPSFLTTFFPRFNFFFFIVFFLFYVMLALMPIKVKTILNNSLMQHKGPIAILDIFERNPLRRFP